MEHKTVIKELGSLIIPDPQYGDYALSVMPFKHTGQWIKLSGGFELWENAFNAILRHIPLHEKANLHYLTIDSKFFPTSGYLRREGIHADGNLCVDPIFQFLNGEKRPTWNKLFFDEKTNTIEKDWESQFNIDLELGEYISSEKGGIFCVSSEVGCQAWQGEFYGEVGAGGDYSSMKSQLTEDKKVLFQKNTLYFMTSNTPHETLLVEKGKRRTFLRITLNHDYPNEILPCMASTNELKGS